MANARKRVAANAGSETKEGLSAAILDNLRYGLGRLPARATRTTI